MKKINIIYLLPEFKGASGGGKVIYKHSIILNNLKKNISSEVLHLKKNSPINLKHLYQRNLNF